MRTITKHFHDFERKDGTTVALELPYPMSPAMGYRELLTKTGDDRIIIGYLADDSDVADPCQEDAYMGHIYSCQRGSSTLKDYEQALGLRDGGPDLELVPEEQVVEEAIRRILADEDLKAQVLAYCDKHWPNKPDGGYINDFIKECLDSINELTPVIDVPALQLEMWRAGRKAGTIGNPYAVLLDVHEHGMVHYLVNSGGQQDFDVARCGAVWVPSAELVEYIKDRGRTYQKGYVNKVNFQDETWYEIMLWASPHNGTANSMPGGRAHPYWRSAFTALHDLDAPKLHTQRQGEMHAAEELAAQAAATYTDWCNGNCFGIVVAEYDNAGGFVGHDTCWGHIGDDDAYAALQDNFPTEEK